MEMILIFTSMLGGALLGLLYRPDEALALRLAKAYIILVLILGAAAWVYYFAGIKNQFIAGIIAGVVNSGKYPARILLGYLTSTIFLSLKHLDEGYPLQKLTRLTITGVSLTTGLSFLIATEGKADNLGDMIAFFKQSGYATWFLYFIMVMETLGAIGVLVHYRLKTGPLATTGLMLIMIGALYTHRHNKDPFSDSYAALSQFLTLGLMLMLYYFEYEVKNSKSGDKSQPANVGVGAQPTQAA